MLRQWYYGSGGLFMSEGSRDRYGDVQKLVGWLVAGREDSADQVTGREYKYVMDRCSALRTALTQDLETRSSRPMWNLRRRRARRRWYVGERRPRGSASPSPKPSQINEQPKISESKTDRPLSGHRTGSGSTCGTFTRVPSLRRAGNRDSLPATCIMGTHNYRIWIGRRSAHSVLRPHLTAALCAFFRCAGRPRL